MHNFKIKAENGFMFGQPDTQIEDITIILPTAVDEAMEAIGESIQTVG
jgi:hypothetical protein